jgi:hypothetical protein
LAWGSRDYLDLFFLRLLFLPIASLFASGHDNLLWLMNRLSPSGNYGLVIAREQRVLTQKARSPKARAWPFKAVACIMGKQNAAGTKKAGAEAEC